MEKYKERLAEACQNLMCGKMRKFVKTGIPEVDGQCITPSVLSTVLSKVRTTEQQEALMAHYCMFGPKGPIVKGKGLVALCTMDFNTTNYAHFFLKLGMKKLSDSEELENYTEREVSMFLTGSYKELENEDAENDDAKEFEESEEQTLESEVKEEMTQESVTQTNREEKTDVQKVEKQENIKDTASRSESVRENTSESKSQTINKKALETYYDVEKVKEYAKGWEERVEDMKKIVMNIKGGNTLYFPGDGLGVGDFVCKKLKRQSHSGDNSDVMVKTAKERGNDVKKEHWKETVNRATSKDIIVLSHMVEFCEDIVGYILDRNLQCVVFESTLGYPGYGRLIGVAGEGKISVSNRDIWRGIDFTYSFDKLRDPLITAYYGWYSVNRTYCITTEDTIKHLMLVRSVVGRIPITPLGPRKEKIKEILCKEGFEIGEEREKMVLLTTGTILEVREYDGIYDLLLGEWIKRVDVIPVVNREKACGPTLYVTTGLIVRNHKTKIYNIENEGVKCSGILVYRDADVTMKDYERLYTIHFTLEKDTDTSDFYSAFEKIGIVPEREQVRNFKFRRRKSLKD